METKPSTRLEPSARIMLAAMLVFIFLFVFFMYTFLHEAGHALVGFAFGQTLTEFDVSFWDFSAHVGMLGSLTEPQRALQSAAGAGLPLLVWLVTLSVMPRKANFSLEALKLIGSMAVLNTLLAWIFIPILALAGQAPADDVTNFLRASQMPPLLLLGIAVALYAAGWRLFLARIDGLRSEFLLFSQTDPANLNAGARSSFAVMAALAAACAALTVFANFTAAKNPADRLTPPEGFQRTAQINLSTRAYQDEIVAQFSLDKPADAGVFVVINNINTTYFDLSLKGPDGFSKIITHGEGYRAARDGGLWEQNLLPAGEYRLVLNSHASPGSVSIYLRLPAQPVP